MQPRVVKLERAKRSPTVNICAQFNSHAKVLLGLTGNLARAELDSLGRRVFFGWKSKRQLAVYYAQFAKVFDIKALRWIGRYQSLEHSYG